jgi:hypothetical protein
LWHWEERDVVEIDTEEGAGRRSRIVGFSGLLIEAGEHVPEQMPPT